MKVEVIQSFHDINDFSRVYSPGEVIDVGKERADALLSRNLCRTVAVEKTRKRKSESNFNDHDNTGVPAI